MLDHNFNAGANTPFDFDESVFGKHLCADGLCIENKAFETFKRFCSLQTKESIPHSAWHTALHEAAHAVVAIDRGLEIKHATVVANEKSAGHVAFEKPSRDIMTDNKSWIDAALAGFVLDQSCRSANDGARYDLVSAFKTALDVALDRYPELALHSGKFPSFVCVHDNPLEGKVDELIQERIMAVVMDMSGLADQIMAVATTLNEVKTLSREEVEDIVNNPDVVFAIHADRVDEAAELQSAISDLLLAIRRGC